MKAKLLGAALFALTVAAVILYPALARQAWTPKPPIANHVTWLPGTAPRVDVVFVLDTTGSMGGLIEAAREKIWSIASTLGQGQPAPQIRMGLVAYRDRGDQYVTRVIDLSADLDSMYAALMDFEARGGGDRPESVNQALHDAVHRMSWSEDPRSYKVTFVVGDAPPHMDYADEARFPEILAVAREKGIVVNSIQCGDAGATERPWQQIAQLGNGRYFQVDQAGSALTLETPYDADIARLSALMDDTRLYYGSVSTRTEMAQKKAATEKMHASASDASRARRGVFNLGASGRANLLGQGELVNDVASGRVALEALAPAMLPDELRGLAAAGQLALIQGSAKKRADLQRQISELADKRDEHLARQVAAEDGARESLDHKIYETVREQAAQIGLVYDSGPAY